MRRLAALAAVTLACGGSGGDEGGEEGGGPPVVAVPYGERFDLGLGRRALVGGEFAVVFERVAEESRCPAGARCVQAGNAAAAFAVESDAGRATLTLNTGREPTRAAAMGGEVGLIELSPPPAAGAAPDTTEYVATLVVSPAP